MKVLRFIAICGSKYTRSIMSQKTCHPFTRQKHNMKYSTLTGLPIFSTSYIQSINLNEETGEEGINNPLIPRNSIQEACNNSLEATTELLNRIFESITDAASQYKTSLNELCSFLENYEILTESADACVGLEVAIVGARAKVTDHEQKYLELITVMQSVEQLTKATCELSFLMREEGLVMALSQTLNSVRESINLDSNEIAEIKKKLWRFQESVIQNANTTEEECIPAKLEPVLEMKPN